VLVKGDIKNNDVVPVRMHALNILNDVLGDKYDDKQDELHNSMKMIEKEGCGVIVLLREPNKSSLSDIVGKRLNDKESNNQQLRDYGIGAQILLDLGVKKMKLLTNSKRSVVGLEGYELEIVGLQEIG